MGEIYVKFVGICVHVTLQPMEVPHRVVLLEHRGGPIEGLDVKEHTPLLFLPPPREVALDCLELWHRVVDNTYALRGVQMSVVNAIGDLAYDQSYWKALPHLTKRDTVIQPNYQVIHEGKKPAAGYFDITAGRFTACKATDDDAIGTTVRIETDGDPVVNFRCFDADAASGVDVPFGSGALLQFFNTADGHDTEDDYLINYLVCEPFPPPDKRVAPEKTRYLLDSCFGGGKPPIPLDFSPKCSNTGYP